MNRADSVRRNLNSLRFEAFCVNTADAVPVYDKFFRRAGGGKTANTMQHNATHGAMYVGKVSAADA
jgi:hypothetical protein